VQTYFVSDCQIDEEKTYPLQRTTKNNILYYSMQFTFKWFSGFRGDLQNKIKIPH
jgi:hypothetical protein